MRKSPLATSSLARVGSMASHIALLDATSMFSDMVFSRTSPLSWHRQGPRPQALSISCKIMGLPMLLFYLHHIEISASFQRWGCCNTSPCGHHSSAPITLETLQSSPSITRLETKVNDIWVSRAEPIGAKD